MARQCHAVGILYELQRLEPLVHEADDPEFLRFGGISKPVTTFTICLLQAADQGRSTLTLVPLSRPLMRLWLQKCPFMTLKIVYVQQFYCKRTIFVPYGYRQRTFHRHNGMEPKRLS
jgi:hypothetical protein